MIAVALGFGFGWKLFTLGRQVTGSLAYSFTYFMYAVMITSGLVVHCLFLVECTGHKDSQVAMCIVMFCSTRDLIFLSQLYLDFARVDCSLTSCIAASFAFNGLVDLKLVSERSYISWQVTGTTL